MPLVILPTPCIFQRLFTKNVGSCLFRGSNTVDLEIPKIVIPDITLDITAGPGRGVVAAHNLNITKFKSPNFNFLLNEKGLSWSSSGRAVKIGGLWEAEYTIGVPLRESGWIDILAADIQGNVSARVLDIQAHPQMVVGDCTANTVHFDFREFAEVELLADVVYGPHTCHSENIEQWEEAGLIPKMMVVWLGETVPNCLLSSAHEGKLVQFTITKDIPELASHLRTSRFYIHPKKDHMKSLARMVMESSSIILPEIVDNRLTGSLNDTQLQLWEDFFDIDEMSKTFLTMFEKVFATFARVMVEAVLHKGVPLPIFDNVTTSGKFHSSLVAISTQHSSSSIF
ncbi:hypothetical protein GCK32_014057 [Trichostrongylus colubriformis]|uniref:Lipid-binding serum glycoprotein N-terminal domain-containing protein n=1 Tax=Trichostrongylus colubriformis TaxID=6319 RepID=A0AAN8IGY1_TRICO